MNLNKRGFFKSLASIVATVALAPEIAFGRKLEMPLVEGQPKTYWAYRVVNKDIQQTLQADSLEEIGKMMAVTGVPPSEWYQFAQPGLRKEAGL